MSLNIKMGKINLLSYKSNTWTHQNDNLHKWCVTQEHIFPQNFEIRMTEMNK